MTSTSAPSSWVTGMKDFSVLETRADSIRENMKGSFWFSDQGKALEARLSNCKNLCYRCHLCERTFGLPDMDTAFEMQEAASD